jgi:hypothetical protein
MTVPAMPKKILLQTTIPAIADDWNIARFHLLSEFLDRQQAPKGSKLFRVTARDRDGCAGPDSLLSRLDETDFDELWLFAVDTGRSTRDYARNLALWLAGFSG